MNGPRVLLLRSPGTNCDLETAYAFQLAGGRVDRIHVNRLLEQPKLLAEYQMLCLPGGFSYGDDLAAGRILAARLRHHLDESLRAFRDADKLVLGICNGFQVLIQSGLLLPVDPAVGPIATLAWNQHGRFEDRWVELTVTGTRCVFLRGMEHLELPVAHAEGQFVCSSESQWAQLAENGQLVLRYGGDPSGRAAGAPQRLPFPANPNGSQGDVAGICDPTGRVFGLMPHPERFVDRTQHPRWTRESIAQPGAGLQLFKNAVEYFSA